MGEPEYQPLLEEILDAILFIIDRASDNCQKYSLKLFTVVLRLYSSKYSQYLSVKVGFSMAHPFFDPFSSILH